MDAPLSDGLLAVRAPGPFSKPSGRPRWSRMEGASAASRRLDASILRVAEFDCTTLVTGETGCGKEEVARAIHAAGKRAQKPFVTINCGGLPASIAESQFFGHEKGSFTEIGRAHV